MKPMGMQILKRLWRFIVRMDVVSILIVVPLGLAAIGSCFPQLPSSIETDPTNFSLWQTQARMRYGAFVDMLTSAGAFHFFHSPLFLLSLAVLVVSTLICTLDRWKALWRRTFLHEISYSDATFQTTPYTAKLAGKGDTDLSKILRKHLEDHGFRIRSKTDHGSLHIRGDRNRIALLATLISHLAVVLLFVGTLLSAALGWREEFIIEPDQWTTIPHHPGTVVRYEGFTIERYPDNGVADYEVKIVITNEIGEIVRGIVRLNKPLNYHGMQITLMGYRKEPREYTLTFLAVHDPGYGASVLAGGLLLLGMVGSFNFPHCCIQARYESDGTLLIAGRADRRAYGFEREFSSIVVALEKV
jgi:cytochrome c biogenesis protein